MGSVYQDKIAIWVFPKNPPMWYIEREAPLLLSPIDKTKCVQNQTTRLPASPLACKRARLILRLLARNADSSSCVPIMLEQPLRDLTSCLEAGAGAMPETPVIHLHTESEHGQDSEHSPQAI